MNNDEYWDCGTKKSTDNAFAIGLAYNISWRKLNQNANNSAVSSRTVERRRKNGETVGVIAMMGRGLQDPTKRKGNIAIEPSNQVQGSADKRQKLKRGAAI